MSDTDSPRRGQLDQILRGAELLIEYSSRNAMKPEGLDDAQLQELILRIAGARAAHDAKGLTGEEEAKFFGDFRVLSRAFLPVTVGSIRDARDDESGRCRQYIWWGPPISPAAAVVRRFTLCTLVALVTLLVVQIIWLVGYDLSDRIRALQKEQIASRSLATLSETAAANLAQETADKKEAEAKEAEAVAAQKSKTLDSSLPPKETADAQANAKKLRDAAEGARIDVTDARTREKAAANKLSEDQTNRGLQEKALGAMLTRWVSVFRWMPLFPKTDAEDPEANPEQAIATNKQLLMIASIMVTILQTYCLPLLYGFLGTCAYVLRQLTIETRARIFRREEELGFWLRIFLGILAGLAVGWFMRPEVDKDGLVRGLTPFALSFLAGYSVEVLFAGMDRLVSAFGSSGQGGKG